MLDSLIRDVCRDHAVVTCKKTSCVDELIYQGCTENLDLIVLTPDNIKAKPGQLKSTLSHLNQALRAIQTIKQASSVPILALSVPPEHEMPLMEAGADFVVQTPFNCDEFKGIVRRALNVSIHADPVPEDRWSIAQTFLRSFQRLTQVS